MVDITQLREEYERLKSVITATAPFIASLLRKVRIILTYSSSTAGAVSYKGIMILRPDEWLSLPLKDKVWLLSHEVLHIAFRDQQRCGSRNPILWNYVSDLVNNEILTQMLPKPERLGGVFIDEFCGLFRDVLSSLNLDVDDVKQMSKEEIYRLIPKPDGGGGKGGEGGFGRPRCPKCGSDKDLVIKRLKINRDGTYEAKFKCRKCGHEWDDEGTIGTGWGETRIPVEKIEVDLPPPGTDFSLEGEVLQEGDQSLYDEELTDEELEERWKEEVSKAYTAQKMAGTIPAALRRVVERLLRPKVDWRSLLRQAFRYGMGRTVVSTWKRPSRKLPVFPGLRRFTIPTVWFLIDTSGSISQRELDQFVSEVYTVAGETPVKVICWDAEAYEPLRARSKSDVVNRVWKKMRGGGGTKIQYALKKTLAMMRPRDIVVVLTDGYIWDIDEDETKSLLSTVASKSSVAVFASTGRTYEIPPWISIRIEVENSS